jgi:hypothetical protein
MLFFVGQGTLPTLASSNYGYKWDTFQRGRGGPRSGGRGPTERRHYKTAAKPPPQPSARQGCRPLSEAIHNLPPLGGHNPRGAAPSTLTPQVCPKAKTSVFPELCKARLHLHSFPVIAAVFISVFDGIGEEGSRFLYCVGKALSLKKGTGHHAGE